MKRAWYRGREADRSEVPFVVNMGCHAGSAFVGVTRFVGRYGERWTYTASGPVTNLAARLCALAQDGAILLSEVPAASLAGTHTLQPLGEHRLKNIGRMVRVYRLLGEPTGFYRPEISSRHASLLACEELYSYAIHHLKAADHRCPGVQVRPEP